MRGSAESITNAPKYPPPAGRQAGGPPGRCYRLNGTVWRLQRDLGPDIPYALPRSREAACQLISSAVYLQNTEIHSHTNAEDIRSTRKCEEKVENIVHRLGQSSTVRAENSSIYCDFSVISVTLSTF